MVEINVQVPPSIRRRLKQFRGDISPRKLLEVAGEAWVGEIQRTFNRGGRKGERWKPLAESTVASRRKSSNRPLLDAGTLRQSFARGRKGNIHELRPTFVRVGSNLFYAEFHDQGVSPSKINPILPTKKKALKFTGPGGETVFAKKVTEHPGIPRRPIIPTERVAIDIAEKAMQRAADKAALKFNR